MDSFAVNNAASGGLVRIQDKSLNKPCMVVKGPPSGGEVQGLPLASVKTFITIRESLAHVCLQQTFRNPESQEEGGKAAAPVELTYQFPKLKDALISRLAVRIGDDRVVEAVVKEKEAAQNVYDDAVAAGHGAVMLQEDQENQEQYSMNLGNVQPGQTAVVNIEIQQVLESQGGLYSFKFPTMLLPDVDCHGQGLCENHFELKLSTKANILEVCHPENCEIVDQSVTHAHIKMKEGSLQDLAKRMSVTKMEHMHILYRTSNMDKPRLLAQKSKAVDGYVALMAQFMPTFSQVQPQDAKKVKPIKFMDNPDDMEELQIDQKMEKLRMKKQPKFFFVLDRSGSMSGDRIRMALEALNLFLMSLPSGCGFQIISFGSKHSWLDDSTDPIVYNNENLLRVKGQIASYGANYGGTEIYNPVQQIFELKKKEPNEDWNVFLLTDGRVADKERVIKLIDENCHKKGKSKSKVRVFAFGIGNGVDKSLIEGSATSGQGKSYYVSDQNKSQLKSQVIDALQHASEPYLEGCKFRLNYGTNVPEAVDPTSLMPVFKEQDLGNLVRNQLVHCFFMVKQENFDNKKFHCQFSCDFDPKTQKTSTMEFTRDNFTYLYENATSKDDQAPIGFALDKFAANQVLLSKASSALVSVDRAKVSAKYQVLCDLTSFVGVVKKKKGQSLSEQEVIKIDVNKVFKEKERDREVLCTLPMQSYGRQRRSYMNEGLQLERSSLLLGAAPRSYAAAASCRSSARMSMGSAKMSKGMSMAKAKPSKTSAFFEKMGSIKQSISSKMSMPKMSFAGAARATAAPPQEDMMMSRSSMKQEKSRALTRCAEPSFASVGAAAQSSYGCAAQASYGSAYQSSEMDSLQKKLDALNSIDGSVGYSAPTPKAQAQIQSSEADNLEERLQALRGDDNDKVAKNMMANMFQSKKKEPPVLEKLAEGRSVKSGVVAATPQNYDQILAKCTTEGHWQMDAFDLLALFLPQDEVENLRAIVTKGHQDVSSSTDFKNFILTILALQILAVHFNAKQDEWKMIKIKSQKWKASFKSQYENKKDALDDAEKKVKAMVRA